MEVLDRGWAWVVAFAACLISFILNGLARTSGILYVSFIEDFHLGRKEASLPFSVRSCTRYLLGPVVGILGQKYGVRKVIVIGAVILTVSSTLCFFATDILWITILFGGVGGAGAALTTCLIQVVISQYFKKHKSTAAGMGYSGGCVGSFVFPAMMEYLIMSYGIGGTFLFISGIVMHCIPAAMLLRKPSFPSKSIRLSIHSRRDDLMEVNLTDECFVNNVISEGYPDVELLQRNNQMVIKLLMLKDAVEIVEENDITAHNMELSVQVTLEAIYHQIRLEKEEQQELKRNLPFLENSIFHKTFEKQVSEKMNHQKNSSLLGTKINFDSLVKASPLLDASTICNATSFNNVVFVGLRNLFQMQMENIFDQLPNERREEVFKVLVELRKLYYRYTHLENIQNYSLDKKDQVSNNETVMKPEKGVNSNSFRVHVKNTFKLYADPMFLLICFCRIVHFVTFLPVTIIIVDFTIDKGLQAEEGKYVIAALSLGDLLGRLCLGWITDHDFMSMPRFMMTIMVLQGVNTAILALVHSRLALYIFLCLFGMLQGSLFVRHPVLIARYFGDNKRSIAMGCMNFFPGIVGLGLPLYIGFFRDTLGSYDNMFFINGAIGVIIGLLWIFEPQLHRNHLSNDYDQK